MKLVNAGLFKSTLKRFWPIWVALFAVMGFSIILPFATQTSGFAKEYAMYGAAYLKGIWTYELIASSVVAFFAGVISATLTFSYLFKTSGSVFYGSLPMKRHTIFLTLLVAGFLPIICVSIAICLILIAISFVIGLGKVLVWACLCWLAQTLAIQLLFYAVAVLCSYLTGNRIIAVVIYLAANVVIPGIELGIRSISGVFLYGVSTLDNISTMWASPATAVSKYMLIDYAMGDGMCAVNWIGLLIICAASIAMIVIAMILSVKRGNELAEESVAFAAMKPVLKYLASIGLAIVAAVSAAFLVSISAEVLDGGDVATICIAMCIGAILGLIFAQMLISRKTRVMSLCWKGSIAMVVLSIAFCCSFAFDLLNIEGYVPDREDVKSVEVYCGEDAVLSEGANVDKVLGMHHDLIGLKGIDNSNASMLTDVNITYTLKSGRKVHREYPISVTYQTDVDGNIIYGDDNPIVNGINNLMNSKEGRLSRANAVLDKDLALTSINIQVSVNGNVEDADVVEAYDSEMISISKDEISDFVNEALKPDLLESELGEYSLLGMDNDDKHCLLTIEDNSNPNDWNYESFSISKKSAPNIAKWVLEKRGVDIG